MRSETPGAPYLPDATIFDGVSVIPDGARMNV
jgi:hypothetical protein